MSSNANWGTNLLKPLCKDECSFLKNSLEENTHCTFYNETLTSRYSWLKENSFPCRCNECIEEHNEYNRNKLNSIKKEMIILQNLI